MQITLCDFLGRDNFRFSPYVWRTKLALAHKKLDYEVVGTTFLDKSALEGWTGYRLAPVLKHGDTVVCDSWEIANYLERTWPADGPLFPDRGSRALASFLNAWVPAALYPVLLPLITRDVLDHVHPDDREHYRRTREARLGRSLEEAQAGRDEDVIGFRDALEPFRQMLLDQAYLSGDRPAYADFILFALFQWARNTSRFKLLTTDDPVHDWRRRMAEDYHQAVSTSDGYPY